MVVTWSFNSTTNTATASGAGSTNFAALVAADVAGGWGKFTADATGTQILCLAKIVIGDASNACVFTDTNKQIFEANTLTSGQYFIDVKNYSTLTLGELINATAKTTRNGCTVYSTSGYNTYLINSNTGGVCNFYSNTFGFSTANYQILRTTKGNIYHCLFQGLALTNFNGDLYDSYMVALTTSGDKPGLNVPGTAVTINKLQVSAYGRGLVTYLSGFSYYNVVLRNIVTYDVFSSYQNGDINLVNPDFDAWRFYWNNYASGKIFRQYTFDVETDTSATVTLKNAADDTVFSVSSDGTTGKIATQTVSRGYYNQANGDTLQDYGPFTLTISKAGYIPYTHTGIVLDEKIDWCVSLHPQLSGDAIAGDVMLGKTFYSNDADTKLTGTYTPTQLMEQRTKIRRVENPVDELLLMYTGMLTIENQKLRRNRIEPNTS